ncbi:Arylsulfotransferase (ASST) [Rubripirellula tenax]|uniref:Arylsulfotransferase (ASST) n=1 Tax=Rubripirellula tenax TaxID=2528015 RepID=A0A5C6FG06_9BACT|nr:PQQ-binding-like beta-propeller repeat protein [Rubripirellula tenax]TWU59740.1 Arylsulfotransferase (ASST) [Rubripirellula tenax]
MLRILSAIAAVALVWTPSLLFADHEVMLQGNNRLVIVGADGNITWEMRWGGIHDLHVLDNGNILTRQGPTNVVEINPTTKAMEWSYDSATQGGNEGKRIEVHAFERLDNGNTMIAESGAARIIEVDDDGKIVKEIPLTVDHPDPHTDTRLVRSTDAGTYLVTHESDGKVREYDRETGKIVWEYEVPLFGREPAKGHGPEGYGNRLFSALRLPNGNTLIGTGNGHGVIEVTPDKEVVWQIQQDDLADIRLAWVTTIEVLPDGNYVIGNCHAGKGQPLLVEVNPKTKEVVWTFDRFDDFGNAVSNSVLMDTVGESLR